MFNIVLALYYIYLATVNNIYGKCSKKISNTLKLRTPKIIAENNF